jgi:hypothetical protein
MEQAIRERQKNKEYDSITSARQFAESLTEHLRVVSHDKHLGGFGWLVIARFNWAQNPTILTRRAGTRGARADGFVITASCSFSSWPATAEVSILSVVAPSSVRETSFAGAHAKLTLFMSRFSRRVPVKRNKCRSFCRQSPASDDNDDPVMRLSLRQLNEVVAVALHQEAIVFKGKLEDERIGGLRREGHRVAAGLRVRVLGAGR